ncbi:MAG: hypothetical protein Q4F72_12225 [Desulfovibrionaceae bacterium]|nr:hypothetical protein [Desulfovibrionaceae bacterium]
MSVTRSTAPAKVRAAALPVLLALLCFAAPAVSSAAPGGTQPAQSQAVQAGTVPAIMGFYPGQTFAEAGRIMKAEKLIVSEIVTADPGYVCNLVRSDSPDTPVISLILTSKDSRNAVVMAVNFEAVFKEQASDGVAWNSLHHMLFLSEMRRVANFDLYSDEDKFWKHQFLVNAADNWMIELSFREGTFSGAMYMDLKTACYFEGRPNFHLSARPIGAAGR